MSYEELVIKQRELLEEAKKYLLNDFLKFQEIMNEFTRIADDYLLEKESNDSCIFYVFSILDF